MIYKILIDSALFFIAFKNNDHPKKTGYPYPVFLGSLLIWCCVNL
jgi:hypothetical protein